MYKTLLIEPSKICPTPTISLEVPMEINCQGSISGLVTSDGVSPVEGAQVSFASSEPNSISFDPNPAVTNENGEYTSSVTVTTSTVATVVTFVASTEVNNTPISDTQFTVAGCTAIPETIYVANQGSDNASAIDGQSNTLITSFPVQRFPLNLAITPDGNFVYIANFNSASVTVVRVSDNTVIDTVNVQGGSQNLVITPDSQFVYVYNIDARTVSVIRVSDNTVIETIGMGKGNRANVYRNITITPNGQFVYVTNTSDSTVSVIRTSDNTVIKTIDVDTSPLSVASTPDSAFVYVVTAFGAVNVIRTSDQTISDTVNLGLNPQNLAITPDGAFVYVIGNTQFINVIRTSDNSNFANIELTRANFETDIVISPSSDFVYVTSNQVFEAFGALNVIDVASNKVIKQLSLANSPQRLAINTDGSRVYVSNSNPDIVEVIQTSDNTLVTSVNAGGNGGVAISVTP
ncbi:hypothetical protein R9X47_28245 [Wukongibacter baidiensis]|uniref:hypothetical protein n=1 Tax=Wukongibacter baidiensis TaxID=1723361 RepID=UPI003D7F3BD2